MFDAKRNIPRPPMYCQEFEHDSCGIGACVNIKGRKSRETVENALKIVENLEHRAGKDAEGKTGDGVGILTQIPHHFFVRVTEPLGIELGGEREYGIAMIFFPQEELRRNQAKKMFEIIVQKEGGAYLPGGSGEGGGGMYACDHAGLCEKTRGRGEGAGV